MNKLVTITIDGQTVSVPEGMAIVDAAKKNGIAIPVFCHHPKLEPVGMCRMCLVEIGRPLRDRTTGEWLRETDGSLKVQFGPKLETACTTPVAEGMVVHSATDKVTAARKDILEFLLTSHPLDCPVCDKGGECPLQNLTMRHGPGQSRFLFDEKHHLGKKVPLGELIMLDRERCIQCARCVRFQEKIAGDPVIGFYQRGRALEIVTFSKPGFDSIFSGNTTDICPVGALTTVDFRFEARPWEMNSAALICPHCPVGCNLTVNVRREARADGERVIKRVLPRQNEAVNEIWICDKGRFAYHYAQSQERLTQPLVRKDGVLVPTSWDEALGVVAKAFRQAGKDLLTLAGGRLSNEDLFNLHSLTTSLGGKTALNTYMAGGDLTAQVGVAQGTNLSQLGRGSAVLVVACDLHQEAPLWWLRLKQAAQRGAELIVLNPRPTRLDKYARHIIRYPYGAEASTVLAMINSLSTKRPDSGEAKPDREDSVKLATAVEAFRNAENAVAFYGSEGIGLEASRGLAQACANLLIATDHTGRPNNGLIAAWHSANLQGAWDIGFRPTPDLAHALRQAKAVYLAAVDPYGDNAALLASRTSPVAFTVVQELFLTTSAAQADVILPAQSFAEREGTYTSGERRVQRYYPAIPPRPGALPDYAITAQIGQRLGINLESRSPAQVMELIAAQVPDYSGISYPKLAEVTEQWPIVGRQDVYYGGTSYENKQGLGLPLAPASQRGESIALSRSQPLPPAALGWRAVPVTLLYDLGQTVRHSQLLKKRIPQPYVLINPEEARHLNIQDGERISIKLPVASIVVEARLNADVPAGIVLIPRSLGIPIDTPEPVQIEHIPEEVTI